MNEEKEVKYLNLKKKVYIWIVSFILNYSLATLRLHIKNKVFKINFVYSMEIHNYDFEILVYAYYLR